MSNWMHEMRIRKYLRPGDRIAMIRRDIFNSSRQRFKLHVASKAELITSKKETLITT